MGKNETEKAKTSQKTRKEKPLYPTKVVIRRLPPSLTEDRFKEELGEIPPHDFFYFVGSNMSFSPVPFSRAYINFKNPEDIVKFRDQFDGYLFVGERGVEHPAVVEYAPYQGVPKKRSRKDPKCGTIEKDPDYLAFLESLKEKAEPLPSIEVHLEEIEAKKLKKDGSKFPKVTTPLLEYLKMKRNMRNNSRPSSRVSPEKKRRSEKEEIPKSVKKSFSQSSVSSSSKFSNSDSSRNDKHKDQKKTETKGSRGKDDSHGKEKKDKRGGKDTKKTQEKCDAKFQKEKERSRPGSAKGSRRYDERRGREDHPDRGQRGDRGSGRRDHSRQDHEYDEWPKIKSVDSRKKTPEDSSTAKGSGKPERVECPTGASKGMDTRGEKEGKSAASKVKPVEEKGTYESQKSEREREASRSKTRNKDRPDRAIYQPRSHSAKHTESPDKEKSRDTRPTSDKKENRKRNNAERSEPKQGRDEWDHYRDRDHDRSRERKRDRGSRQRDRDRGYKERSDREYKGDHPHERDGGKGHVEKVKNREMRKEPSKEKPEEKKEAKSREHTGAQNDASQ